MYLLRCFASSTCSPISRWLDVSPGVEVESRKALKQPDKEEGSLVVCELLAEADARSSVEGAEDEWVWCQIFVSPFIKEPVWVKFEGCGKSGN